MSYRRITHPFGQVCIGLFIAALLGGAILRSAPAAAQDPCVVAITPYFTEYNGAITVDGVSAPIGTLVEAFGPTGVRTGCFIVAFPGIYGYLRVYGADPATSTPGMSSGQAVTFKVNGAAAQTSPTPVTWSGDQAQHPVGLAALSLPAPVVDLGAGQDASGVKLTWTHVGGNIDHYEVWRSEAPYFTPPAEGTRIKSDIAPAANAGDSMSYTDTTSHLRDTQVQDYYTVVAVGTNGQVSPVTSRAGAFDFSLQPGS